jgi:spermidine/putrescine transport system substrate-binding protein
MYRHAYSRFVSTRRAFLRQSAALAGVAAASPLIPGLRPSLVSAADGAAYANELWAKTKEGLAGADFRKELNVHAWEGYTEEQVLDPFSQQTGASVNAQMLISDPAAVNNLRGGGTSTWDIINLNNAWQRKELYPEGLIVPLDKTKFEPLYAMNTKGFEWPYHWAMDASGENLLGMIQRYGPSAVAVNSDALSPDTIESGGYMELIEGAAGQYGILDYENWVIMHTCMATGFTPFRKHTDDEMAAYEEMIFKVFKNAKKVSDDQAALARDMITGEIVGTFFGSLYTVSAARNEGETQLVAVVPREGPEETKSADHPDGQAGIIWIEVTRWSPTRPRRRWPRRS